MCSRPSASYPSLFSPSPTNSCSSPHLPFDLDPSQVIYMWSGYRWLECMLIHIGTFWGPEVLAPCVKHVAAKTQRGYRCNVVTVVKSEISCQDPAKSYVCFVVELRICIRQAFVSWGLKAHVESRWWALGGWAMPNDLEGNKWKLERTTFKYDKYNFLI